MPVTTTAQSPTDMELSGEGSDVDMIHDDDTGLDPEDDEDDEDEPEPEEVSPHCDGAQARPLTAFRRTSNQTSFLPRPRPINRGSRSSSSYPRYLAQMNRLAEGRPRPAVNRAGRPRIVPSPGVRKNECCVYLHSPTSCPRHGRRIGRRGRGRGWVYPSDDLSSSCSRQRGRLLPRLPLSVSLVRP